MDNDIKVSVKAGLLRTIAHSIYSEPIVKIREAVSNSVDNKATIFIITVNQEKKIVSLFDNGHGIDPAYFRRILGSIGSGKTKKDKNTNSYFGLGLMSVLQMAEKAILITRPKKSSSTYKYIFNSKEIFSEDVVDDEMATITKFIEKEVEISAEDRRDLSPLTDNDLTDHGVSNLSDCSFTEILLTGVETTVVQNIVQEDFQLSLRKSLPLQTADNEQFFGRFHENQSSLDVVYEMLNDVTLCPTIKVMFHIVGEEAKQLFKYYPTFNSDVSFRECDFFYRRDPDNNYAWYYVISTRDLQKGKTKTNVGRKGKSSEAGFWIRNKNFLVKASDYLKHPDSGKEIISQPLRNWIFGEIFHKDMTSMLVVTRNEFVWHNESFIELRNELESDVKAQDRLLREAWSKSKAVIDSLISPLKKLHSGDDFSNVHKSLIACNVIETEEDCEKLLNDIGDALRVQEIEDETKRIDVLLELDQNRELEVLNDLEERIKVVISSQVDNEDGYLKTREGVDGGVVLYISSELFSPTKTTFLGKPFDLNFVAMSSEYADISINVKNSKIYVNPFNRDISKFKLDFYEVLVAIKIAQVKCKNTDDMARMIIDIVGHRFYNIGETSKKCMDNLNKSLAKRG